MKMIRNAVGKGKLVQYYCMGRSQYRAFSSVIEKEAKPTGQMMKIGEKLIGYSYLAGMCGVGFVLGGLALPADAPKVLEDEKLIAEMHQSLDSMEECIRKRVQQFGEDL